MVCSLKGEAYETYHHVNLSEGGGCFTALNRRTKAFVVYSGKEIEVLAFMKCSGCGHFPGRDDGLDEKIRYILESHPDVVHLGICCCHDARGKVLCEEISALRRIFEDHGISVVRGTHSIF